MQQDSQDAYYYNLCGFAYFNLDNDQAATNDFNKAIDINSKEPSFYNNRGSLYEKLQAAINEFKIAATLYSQQVNKQEYRNIINKIKFIKSRLKILNS